MGRGKVKKSPSVDTRFATGLSTATVATAAAAAAAAALVTFCRRRFRQTKRTRSLAPKNIYFPRFAAPRTYRHPTMPACSACFVGVSAAAFFLNPLIPLRSWAENDDPAMDGFGSDLVPKRRVGSLFSFRPTNVARHEQTFARGQGWSLGQNFALARITGPTILSSSPSTSPKTGQTESREKTPTREAGRR